ncbi:MAG: hypothetical protein HYV04_07075 [Deltaproteobacteria bacterium]|nr:hypothetical protein [Deltaproteobacteria bacterium]
MAESFKIRFMEGAFDSGADGPVEWRGYWLKDQDNMALRFDDPRLEKAGVGIFKVTGPLYRKEALEDQAFAPGMKLALVLDKEGRAVSIWDAARKLQLGHVPRQFAALVSGQIRSGRDVGGISLGEWVKNGRRVGLRVIVGPKTLVSQA